MCFVYITSNDNVNEKATVVHNESYSGSFRGFHEKETVITGAEHSQTKWKSVFTVYFIFSEICKLNATTIEKYLTITLSFSHVS